MRDMEPWRGDPDAWKGGIEPLFEQGPPLWYTLDENKQPHAVSMLESGKLLTKDRQVANTYIWLPGRARISTIFLALDHNYFGIGPPILFETMIFGGPQDQYQERYTSWIEAEEGHKRAVFRARIAPIIWLRDKMFIR